MKVGRRKRLPIEAPILRLILYTVFPCHPIGIVFLAVQYHLISGNYYPMIITCSRLFGGGLSEGVYAGRSENHSSAYFRFSSYIIALILSFAKSRQLVVFLRYCRIVLTPVSDSSLTSHTSYTQLLDLPFSLIFFVKTHFSRTKHTNTWYERFYKRSVGTRTGRRRIHRMHAWEGKEKLLRIRNMRSPSANRLNTINFRRRLAPR